MTDVDELAAIRRMILCDKEEDTHRLVYADRLEETGERHHMWMATFIRACIKNGDDDAQGEFHKAIEHTNPFDGASAFGLPNGWDVTCYQKLHKLRSDWANLPRYLARKPSALTRRGFITEVTCSSEDWVKYADRLYWHPEQTVQCPDCDGKSWYHREGVEDDPRDVGGPMDCDGKCRLTGRIHRPYQPAAHPLTSVTLTTEPHESDFGTISHIDWRPEGRPPRTIKYYRWPGITFTIATPFGI